MPEGGETNIRVSSAERDSAMAALAEHLSTGRLDLVEYQERCGVAAAAQTRGELEPLFDDLPAPHPDLSSASRPGQLIQRTGQLVTNPTNRPNDRVETRASSAFEVVAGLSLAFGIPGAILLTIFLGAWWVFIPVGMVIIVAGGLSEATKKPAS